jgi:glucose/arabinose dehydrogenase
LGRYIRSVKRSDDDTQECVRVSSLIRLTARHDKTHILINRNEVSVMRSHRGRLGNVTKVFAVAPLLAVVSSMGAYAQSNTPASQTQSCAADTGITLPPGFCATVFADNIGHARHLVVAPDGVVYVNTWSGRYYGNDTPPAGGFLIALRDTNGDGRADVNVRFGDDFAHGVMAAPASPSTVGRSTPKSTIALSAMNSPPEQSRPLRRPRSSFPNSRSPATTPCIPS